MAAQAAGTLPETQVRAMFDRIARVYDRMNAVMTVGMHQRWRERAADLAAVGPDKRALDVATGTGDLAIALRGRGAEVGVVHVEVGADQDRPAGPEGGQDGGEAVEEHLVEAVAARAAG